MLHKLEKRKTAEQMSLDKWERGRGIVYYARDVLKDMFWELHGIASISLAEYARRIGASREEYLWLQEMHEDGRSWPSERFWGNNVAGLEIQEVRVWPIQLSMSVIDYL